MLSQALGVLSVASILAVCLYRVVTLLLNTRAWQVLLPPSCRPSFRTLLRLRWMGEAINGLLPVGQVGGDVARARLIAARDVPPADAAAAMVVDLGAGVVTHVLFGFAGAVAFALQRGGLGGHGAGPGPARVSPSAAVTGLAFGGVILVAVILLLRETMARLLPWMIKRSHTGGRWAELAGGIARFEEALSDLLARRRALASAAGWHLAAWCSQIGETWILLAFFGAPPSLPEALAIEGLAAAVRGAAFFIPGGLGVQELTVVTLAMVLGVPPAPALAVGLAKRARELVIGLPGLLAWIVDERPALRRWQARVRAFAHLRELPPVPELREAGEGRDG